MNLNQSGSHSEQVSSKGNGCGPDWFPVWIKELLFNWFFEASCNKHDEGYRKGGNEARRAHCDLKFLEAMKKDASNVNVIFKPLAYSTAYTYYLLVRIFGRYQFNYSEK
jgi:hypothetical protein